VETGSDWLPEGLSDGLWLLELVEVESEVLEADREPLEFDEAVLDEVDAKCSLIEETENVIESEVDEAWELIAWLEVEVLAELSWTLAELALLEEWFSLDDVLLEELALLAELVLTVELWLLAGDEDEWFSELSEELEGNSDDEPDSLLPDELFTDELFVAELFVDELDGFELDWLESDELLEDGLLEDDALLEDDSLDVE
jgi:hypothetical protein